jgi:hypothetical protein
VGERKSGGISVGNVGRNVTFKAGKDLVAGDKTTTTTRTARAGAEDEGSGGVPFATLLDEFRADLQKLEEVLRASSEIAAEQRTRLVVELAEHVKALAGVHAQAMALPDGETPSKDLAISVESTLNRVGHVVETAGGVATKATGLAETVATLVARLGPLLSSARHWFGIP